MKFENAANFPTFENVIRFENVVNFFTFQNVENLSSRKTANF